MGEQVSRQPPRLRRRRVASVVALAGLTLVGCNGLAPSSGPAADSAPNVAEKATAADFRLIAYQGEAVLGGKELALSDLLKQGKPVVLNFWAGLCPPCRLEMPDLQSVYDEYQDRILLLGLDVGPFVNLGSQEDGQALLRELNITYPAGTAADADVVRAYRLLGMPTTVFITPEGNVANTWTGFLTREKTVELIQELLAASGV